MSTINHELNNYDRKESTRFGGLIPVTMEKLGDDYVIGGSVIPSGATVNNLAPASLQVIDAVAIMSGSTFSASTI